MTRNTKSKSTATCPTKISILSKVYRVDRQDKAENQGLCLNQQLVIAIQTGNALGQEQDTVLHEVLHAVDYAMQTKMNERQIAAIATGLLSVLKENPSLVEYLLDSSSM
jgi:hypothetical protein